MGVSWLAVERTLAVALAFYIGYAMIAETHRLSLAGPKVCWRKTKPAWPWLRWLSPHDRLDYNDQQWRQFSRELPVLAVGLAVYVAVMKIIRWRATGVTPLATATAARSTSSAVIAAASTAIDDPAIIARVAKSVRWQALVNFGVLLYLHRSGAIHQLLHVGLMFLWATHAHRRVPKLVYFAVAWAYAVTFLIAANVTHGFGYGWLTSVFGASGTQLAAVVKGNKALDFDRAPMRWYVVTNMLTLRILAYLHDSYESREAAVGGSGIDEKKKTKNAGIGTSGSRHDSRRCVDCVEFQRPCYKASTLAARPLQEVTFAHYFAYLSYFPLYIAGPTMTFNAFVAHQRVPQGTTVGFGLVRYALRCGLNWLCLMGLVHATFVSCLMRQPEYIKQQPVLSQACLMLIALCFLWLKFNVIWKFFRLFALIDGVDCPENMRRCFGSSTTIANFWRDWHASFNQWIVRYMYVPLGGSRAKVWAIAPIFTFVALWHDIELRLIRWAGVMCVAFVLEVIVGAVVARSAWLLSIAASKRPLHVHAYRHLQAVGGALSTFSLIVANLYGFGTGDTGTTNGVGSLLTWAEVPTLMWCLWLLYVENLISNFSRDVDRAREQRRELRVLGANSAPGNAAAAAAGTTPPPAATAAVGEPTWSEALTI